MTDEEKSDLIRELRAELERLKRDNAFMASNDYVYSLTSEIERLKAEVQMMAEQTIKFRDMAVSHAALCTRAADALENLLPAISEIMKITVVPLIAELRKAATE